MPSRLRSATALLALTASLLLAGPTLAGTGDEWNIAPYLWIAGFEGTIGGAGGDSDTGDHGDFQRVWNNVGLAGAMVNASWRRNRWTAFGD